MQKNNIECIDLQACCDVLQLAFSLFCLYWDGHPRLLKFHRALVGITVGSSRNNLHLCYMHLEECGLCYCGAFFLCTFSVLALFSIPLPKML